MSKNPFRRQQLDTPRGLDLPQDAAASSRALGEPASAGDLRRGSKTKRVRIATPPPLSPDSVNTSGYDSSPIQRFSDGSHSGSPPPESLSDSSDSTIEPAVDDPFGRASDEGELSASEEVAYNTRRNSDMTLSPPHPVPPPGNPFHKTLATMEAGTRHTNLSDKPPNSQSPAAEQKSQRSVMDVDAFTRLLMTGNAASTSSGDSPAAPPVPGNPSGNIAADSSSTDTSSLSRHSIFESGLEPPSETPRTSTEETRTDDYETTTTTGRIHLKKNKPPLPKPRHGKSVQRVPEPSLGLTEPSATAEVSTETPRKDVPLPPPSRKSAQPYRPLPPPPTTFSTPHSENDSSDGDEGYQAAQLKGYSPPTRAAVPSRGSSQTVPSRDSSSRTLPIRSSLESPTAATMGNPKTDRAPPPPPTRRSGHRSQAFASEQSSTQSASSSPSIRPVATGSADVPTQPLSRSASTSSRNQMPPPPPPRRRRGSSKSSLEGPRVVMSPSPRSSLDYSSAGPLSPPAREDVAAYSTRNSRDVLAEMSALQEEVDALRAQYGKSG